MKILNKEEIKEIEPNLNDTICSALYAPTAGIISPWELAIALAENAIENGVELKLETTVNDIQKQDGYYTVVTDKGNIDAKYVINCAGVFSDKISNMVAEPYFEIKPRKGQYYILDKDCINLVNHVIFQCPTEKGKGVLIAPTVHGNVIVGPDSEEVLDPSDLSTTADRLEYVRETALLTSKKIPYNKVIRTFAGIRATSSTGDFIIEEVKDAPGFFNVAGYESPGLSSIPAVAADVVEMVKKAAGELEEKDNFNPYRRKVVRFIELTDEEKAEKIKEDPNYGKVICRCENITEAEIIDCIHRKAGATTLKGVKKRIRAGMGRCQGGFCGPRVVEIIARELNTDFTDVLYDHSGSYILTEETKNNATGGDK